MPATTKALRQPSSVPTRPNRNDWDAPIVKELVYHAAMRARIGHDQRNIEFAVTVIGPNHWTS